MLEGLSAHGSYGASWQHLEDLALCCDGDMFCLPPWVAQLSSLTRLDLTGSAAARSREALRQLQGMSSLRAVVLGESRPEVAALLQRPGLEVVE